MITKYNYHTSIKDIDIEALPPHFRRDHEYFLEYGEFYEKDLSIRQVINNYLIKLNEYLGHLKSNKQYLIRDFYNQLTENEIASLQVRGLSKTKQKLADKLNISLEEILAFDQEIRPQGRKRTVKENVEHQIRQNPPKYPSLQVSSKHVARISEEVKFIKRLISFHNKEKPVSMVLNFIKALQKAILQKQIDRHSRYAKEIMTIQEKMVGIYNDYKHRGLVTLYFEDKDLVHYTEIVGGESVYKSIGLIKRFIGMQGKAVEPKAVASYLKAVERAKITSEDPFFEKVQAIVDFFNTMDAGQSVVVREQELNGLLGALKSLGCNHLGRIYDTGHKELRRCKSKKYSDARKGACSYHGGLMKQEKCKEPETPKSVLKVYRNDRLGRIYDTGQKELRQCNSKKYSDAQKGACSYNRGLKKQKKCNGLDGIMTAEQVVEQEYETLEFDGKYKDLMGKPATNFDMMLFGIAGSGKTTFLIQFAHYLCTKFGKPTLYVSGEEFDSLPLKLKVKELPSFPPNLYFAKNINKVPIPLQDFSFIILDSVTDLGINLETYKRLREECPEAAFIVILQTRKDGNFKGGKEWEHEMEVAGVIEEGTVGIYKNRYGVKGTLNVFDDKNPNLNTI